MVDDDCSLETACLQVKGFQQIRHMYIRETHWYDINIERKYLPLFICSTTALTLAQRAPVAPPTSAGWNISLSIILLIFSDHTELQLKRLWSNDKEVEKWQCFNWLHGVRWEVQITKRLKHLKPSLQRPLKYPRSRRNCGKLAKLAMGLAILGSHSFN